MRNENHLRFVRQLPCIICGVGGGNDPHHLRSHKFGRGMGKKSGDRFCVPLCRSCHTNVHLVGSKEEPKWFEDRGWDALGTAEELWDNTGDVKKMKQVIVRRMPW